MSIWWKKCNSDRWLIKDKHRYDCRNRHACEKDHIWNHNTCSCENGKYLERVMDDSVNTCHEIIESYDEERKTIPTNFNRKKANFKMKNVYILLVFLVSTIALLIAVTIYCYPIKYRAKQKYSLPFHSKLTH